MARRVLVAAALAAVVLAVVVLAVVVAVAARTGRHHDAGAPAAPSTSPTAGSVTPTRPPTPPPRPPTPPVHPCAGRGEDDVARYAFYGYLFGDGAQLGGGWTWTPSPSARSSRRFFLGARLNGVQVVPLRPGDPATGYRGAGPLPDVARLPDDCAAAAFLIGVIEGEGGRDDGLVMDDPDRGPVLRVHALLLRLGFRATVESGAIAAVRVDRADWPRFRPWPFAVRSRVPGG